MGKRCSTEGCRAWALKDSDFCFRHDPRPEYEEKRKRASAKGGRRSRKYPVVREQLPDIFYELKNHRDLASFMEMVINSTMQNQMTLQKGRTLAQQCQIMKTILEASDIEERLVKLEKEVLKHARN